MADASPGPKSTGKLESLPKEELLKFIKKQANQMKELKRKFQECETTLDAEREENIRLEQEKKSWLSRGVSAEFEKKEKLAKKDQELKTAAHLGQQMLEEHDSLQQQLQDQEEHHIQTVERLQIEIFELSTASSELQEKLRTVEIAHKTASLEAKKCRDALEATLSEQDTDQQKQAGANKQATKKVQELKAKLKTIENELNSKWESEIEVIREEKRVMCEGILTAQSDLEETHAAEKRTFEDEKSQLQTKNKELMDKIENVDSVRESMKGRNDQIHLELEDSKHVINGLEMELHKVKVEREKFLKSYKIAKGKCEKSAILEEELKKQLSAIASERDDIQVSLRNINKDKRNLLQSNKKLKNKLKSVNAELDAEDERGTPSPKLDEDFVAQLQSRNKELHEQLENSKGEKDTVLAEKSELEQALTLADKERKNLMENAETCKKNLEDLKFQIDEIQESKSCKSEEISTLAFKLEESCTDKENLNIELQNLNVEIDNIKSQMVKLEDEKDKLITDIEIQVKKSDEIELNLKSELTASKDNALILTQQLSQMTDEKDQVVLRCNDLQRSLNEQQQMAGMNKEGLESEMELIVNDRNTIRNSHEELQLTHKKLTESFEAMEENNRHLKTSIVNLQKEIDVKTKFTEDILNKLEELKNEKCQAEENHESELLKLKNENEDLENKIKALAIESEKTLIDKTAELQSKLQKVSELSNDELETLRNQNKELYEKLEEIVPATKKLESLSMELDTLTKSNQELSETVNELTEHNEELTAKNQESKMSTLHAQDSLNVTNQQILILKDQIKATKKKEEEDTTTVFRQESRIQELLKTLQALNEEKMHQENEIEELFKTQDDLHCKFDEQCSITTAIQDELQSVKQKCELLLKEKEELGSQAVFEDQKEEEKESCDRQDSFTLREELTRLEEELRVTSLQLSDKNAVIEKLELQLIEEQRQSFGRINDAEKDLESLREQAQMYNERRGNMETMLEEEKKSLDEVNQMWQMKVELLNTELETYKKDLNSIKENKVIMEEKVHILEQCKTNNELKLTELTSINNGIREALNEFSKQNSHLHQSLDEKQDKIIEMNKQLDNSTTVAEVKDKNILDLMEQLNETKSNLEKQMIVSNEKILYTNNIEAQLAEKTKAESLVIEELSEVKIQLEKSLCLVKDQNIAIEELENRSVASQKSTEVEENQVHDLNIQIETLTSKLVELESTCSSKEEKLTKLKSVAIKAKREYETMKTQVVPKLNLKLEELENKCKDTEDDAKITNDKFIQLKSDFDATNEKNSGLVNQTTQLVEQCKDLQQLLSTRNEELISITNQLKNSTDENKKLLLKLDEASKLVLEFNSTKESLTKAQENIESLNKDTQQLNLLQLELDDSQRTVNNLQQKLNDREKSLEEKTSKLNEHQSQVEVLSSEAEERKNNITQLEEKIAKLKSMVMKGRKDVKEGEEKSHDQQLLIEEQSKQLENYKFEIESSKVLLAKIMADNEMLNLQMRSAADSHQTNYVTLEQSLQKALDDLSTTQKELETCKSEYDNYKIRARNVLKQQKMKQKESETTVDDEEKTQLEHNLATMKQQLDDTRCELASVNSDQEVLEGEHQRLQLLHKMLETRFNEATQDWQRRLTDVEVAAESAQSGLKERLGLLAEDRVKVKECHQFEIEELKRQLSMASLRQSLSSPPGQSKESDLDASSSDIDISDTLSQRRSSTPNNLHIPLSIKNTAIIERQQGEGMEQIQLDKSQEASAPSTPSNNINSAGILERILSPTTHTPPVFWPNSPNESREEGLKLKAKLSTAEKKLEHLTELLRETEANSMRQNEQVKMLKDEIRRLERNQQREEALNNLEYLKNIIIKFLKCPPAEKEYLVPVICTMLKLDQTEKEFVSEYAKGDSATTNDEANDSWSNYVYRWTAM